MLDASAAEIARETTTCDPAASEKALQDLVRRVAHQDERAVGELYDLTVARLFSLARTFSRNAPDAEEVIVDTYMQVWHRRALATLQVELDKERDHEAKPD